MALCWKVHVSYGCPNDCSGWGQAVFSAVPHTVRQRQLYHYIRVNIVLTYINIAVNRCGSVSVIQYHVLYCRHFLLIQDLRNATRKTHLKHFAWQINMMVCRASAQYCVSAIVFQTSDLALSVKISQANCENWSDCLKRQAKVILVCTSPETGLILVLHFRSDMY